MGSEYIRRFEEPLLRAAQSHLESLYDELIAPLRPFLQGKHLIFVPHGPLHFLPFHALRNGEGYLCDAFTISYAPSATVFSWCQEKPTSKNTSSLVFGIPDVRDSKNERTRVLAGELGPRSGLLHLATHGIYRQDN